MVSETNIEAMSKTTARAGWEPPMPPTDLIFDDGEPLETNRHRNAMNVRPRVAMEPKPTLSPQDRQGEHCSD